MGSAQLSRVWRALIALGTAWIGLHPIHESDPFWHMTLGRAVLRHGSRSVAEPTAYPDFPTEVVVPEWLWGVVTYATHEWFGPVGLSVLAAVLSGLCAWLVCAMCEGLASETDWGRKLAPIVATLVIAAALSRLRLRPQAAFLCLLPALLLVSDRYRKRSGRARLHQGAMAVLLSLVWAQTHGSFVLAPAVFVLQTIPLELGGLRRYLRQDGPVLLAVVASLLSSAHGLHLVHYILDHAGGDASHYVADMVAPTWAGLDPRRDAPIFAIWTLWWLGAVGMLLRRSMLLRPLLVAALGMLLLSTATRFAAAAAVLAAPLALQGAVALLNHLRGPRPLPAVPAIVASTLACTGLLAWAGHMVDARYGPVGRVGIAPGKRPHAAIAFLEGTPRGTHVWNDFSVGGPLGFYLDGHVRTYIDSRTPLHFDDTDFAVFREALQHEDALRQTLLRYRATVAVVERHSQACANFAGPLGWQLVALDPLYSTFAPRGAAQVLSGLRPCGRDFVDQTCSDPVEIASSIERVSASGPASFTALLRAQQILSCDDGDGTALGDNTLAHLEVAAPDARAFSRTHQRDSARALAAAGRTDEALAALMEMAQAADLGVLQPLASPALRDVPEASLLPIVDALSDALGDGLPPMVRAELAKLHALTGNAEQARFHGFRAAARGQSQVLPVLQWLSTHHPTARVRRAAEAWAQKVSEAPNSPTKPPMGDGPASAYQ